MATIWLWHSDDEVMEIAICVSHSDNDGYDICYRTGKVVVAIWLSHPDDGGYDMIIASR